MRIGVDSDHSFSESYMKAAVIDIVPAAFLIGKGGLIEWIGDRLAVADPLEKLVEGKWDRSLFAKEFQRKQQSS